MRCLLRRLNDYLTEVSRQVDDLESQILQIGAALIFYKIVFFISRELKKNKMPNQMLNTDLLKLAG